MSLLPDGLPMRSTLCTNPAMLHGRISGCFLCGRDFFAARRSRVDSQTDRCLTRSQPRAVMESRFLFSARSSAANWCAMTLSRISSSRCSWGFRRQTRHFPGMVSGSPTLPIRSTPFVRSRSDGTERMQLTFPPMDVRFPMISPDGTKVAFFTDKHELFVIEMQGGQPQKFADDDRRLEVILHGDCKVRISMSRSLTSSSLCSFSLFFLHSVFAFAVVCCGCSALLPLHRVSIRTLSEPFVAL